jgi:hypothetical protein
MGHGLAIKILCSKCRKILRHGCLLQLGMALMERARAYIRRD